MVCIRVAVSPLLKILGTGLGVEVVHSSGNQIILGGWWKNITSD